ncbi:MAG: ribonuclease R [Pseudomonadota bacterium]|nr:ribonuclease R [Pseudomonadota bacterium]
MKSAKFDWRQHDPHYEREIEKYGTAAPSREYIRSMLTEIGAPIDQDGLIRRLGIRDEAEREGVERRLNAMLRDGELCLNRKGGFGLVDRMDLVRGRVVGHPDGFGFLIPDDGSSDVYLPPREMRALIHGDRALVRIRNVDRNGRREGAISDVLERHTTQIVGRFCCEGGVAFVLPDNKRIAQDVLIPSDQQADAADGQIVVVDLIEQPTRRSAPIGRIREVLGDHMAPGMEIDVAIRAHGLAQEWSDAAHAECEALGTRVPVTAKRGREDLRDLPLVTIDGADARDFDDAVYCEPNGRGWRLLVAIADVGHYVDIGSALDQEAKDRGTSVYFPERVIPMLPEALSNGLCSLNPRVDRLCMVCALDIGADGQVRRSNFFEAVMRSARRLTYDEFASAVIDGDSRTQRRLSKLMPHLENLHALYQSLRRARETRGALDFETEETQIVFGPDRKIERIVPRTRNDAHRMIEECMIAANVAAAKFLLRHKMPTLFRCHQVPAAERVEDLRTFLAEFGLKLPGGESPTSLDFAVLLEQVAKREDRHLIQTVLLRSLARAEYAPVNEGHFGLSLSSYVHFTSPIRRYPDLVVHRGIRHVLRGGTAEGFRYTPEELERLGAHCSQSERRADDATRDAIDWLKCEYMLGKVGEVFSGRVGSVTSFGLFVELDDIYVEGLVHVTSLDNDYYHFDPVGHRLKGERSGKVYRLGDPMRVRVAAVNLDERKVDFEPIDVDRRSTTRGRRGRRKTKQSKEKAT